MQKKFPSFYLFLKSETILHTSTRQPKNFEDIAHTHDFGFSVKLWAGLTYFPPVCLCSTKICPTTGWTGWASRPPCTETRTAPGPCRRCTSTMGPSCTLTSTRTPPTPIPCLPVWAHRLTTRSREIKTRYTGKCEAAVRGHTGCLAACYPG